MACSHIDPQHLLFQTRSEETGLAFHDTLRDAKTASEKDPTIHKISFTIQTGERIILRRNPDGEWVVEASGILDLQMH